VKRALEDGLLLLRLDPANFDTRSSTAFTASNLASDYEQLGRLRDARAASQQSLEILLAYEQEAANHGDFIVSRYASIARVDAELGDRAASEAAIKKAEPILTQVQAALVTNPPSLPARSRRSARGSPCLTAITNKPSLSLNRHCRRVSPGRILTVTLAPWPTAWAMRR
jgi:hypothetical protein